MTGDGGSHYISVAFLWKEPVWTAQIMPTLSWSIVKGRYCVHDLICAQKGKKEHKQESAVRKYARK